MRTTLTLDDEALEAARKLAAVRHQPLGQVVSDLMRRGLVARARYTVDGDFPTFRVAENSPPITLEDIKRDEDDPA
jgi:hypothetical protein